MNNLVFVNGEEWKWLKTGVADAVHDHKPDMFACAVGEYEPKENRKSFNPCAHYGILADWKLKDSVTILGHAKMDSEFKPFGELIDDMTLLHSRGDAFRLGLVLLPKELWIVKFVEGIANSIRRYGWTDPGGASLLQSSFPAPNLWSSLLYEMTQTLNCVFDYGSTGFGSPFLGKGSYGRVFRVTIGRKRTCALKIVLRKNSVQARIEFDTLKSLEGKECAIKLECEQVVETANGL